MTKVKTIQQGQSHCEGAVSNSTSFRNARDEVFLYKLQKPCQIVEASSNLLDIIGSCEIFVKIPFLKKIKKLECLVQCCNDVDREILVSCETLKKWDIIHCTFGQETVTSYINRCKMTRNLNNLTPQQISNKIKNVSKLSQLYTKSKVPTDELLDKVPPECIKLREKVLRIHNKNFKEKLVPNNGINHPPLSWK